MKCQNTGQLTELANGKRLNNRVELEKNSKKTRKENKNVGKV